MRKQRNAFTLTEIIVVLGLVVLVVTLSWQLFVFFMGSSGKTGVTRLTGRSMIFREARIGMRLLLRRLREATEILDPPGTTVTVLNFKDILNDEIRLCLDTDKGQLVSERKEGSVWVRENKAKPITTDEGTTLSPALPVRIRNVKAVHFAIVSPSSVSVHLALESDNVRDDLMLSIFLRNGGIKE